MAASSTSFPRYSGNSSPSLEASSSGLPSVGNDFFQWNRENISFRSQDGENAEKAVQLNSSSGNSRVVVVDSDKMVVVILIPYQRCGSLWCIKHQLI
jgi:hypothetical protein